MRSGTPISGYIIALFSVIIPVIVGSFNYKKSNTPFKFIYFYLVLTLFREATQVFFKKPILYNTQDYIYTTGFTFFYSLTFFNWAEVKSVKKYFFIEFIIFLLILILEIRSIGISTFRISFLSIIVEVFFSLFAIFLIIKILSNRESFLEKRVKLLILIPFLIFYSYMSIIDIFMLFLYSPSTQKLFSNLYWVIRILNPINYLCVSLAFYLAPKKQVYLQ